MLLVCNLLLPGSLYYYLWFDISNTFKLVIKNILKCLNVVFFFLQEETNPGSIAESKDNSFPFLIFMGTLALPGKIYIAADKQTICSFEVSLVEAALALLATYCVFMYNCPPGLANFYSYIQKCILHISDGKKLPCSLMSFVNSLHELQANIVKPAD